jgi:hypothetical protein
MLIVYCQNYVYDMTETNDISKMSLRPNFYRLQLLVKSRKPHVLKIYPVWPPINVIKCSMQNSFKVIGGLDFDDEPYCRLNSETVIDRVSIKLQLREKEWHAISKLCNLSIN